MARGNPSRWVRDATLPGRRCARFVLAACLLASTAGCAGLYVGVAATGGVMALQERGLGGAGEDIAIRTRINRLWFEQDHETHLRLTLQVWDGRVLVAGVLPDEAQRARAIAPVRGVPGVREVIDAVEIGTPRDVARYAADAQIEKEIEMRLLLTRDVDSINYSVQVVNGRVHLIGTAQDAGELTRALAVMREVGGVRAIASHVVLRAEARRLRGAAASP
jgi:osmotically-inducible protein OsmY